MSSSRSLLVVIALAALVSWGWRGRVETQDGVAMKREVRPGDIRMLSSETCPWCLAARRWMTQKGIPFQECFIERDGVCLSDYQALGASGTPTLVVRGRRVIGFDRAAMAAALGVSGPEDR